MNALRITVGQLVFTARFEDRAAPLSCAGFRRVLRSRGRISQTRGSGGRLDPPRRLHLGLGYENHTSFPAPGEILLYPGGISATEILFPYGSTRFASKVGQLAGNNFLTVVDGRESFRELGRLVLWEGAQDIQFEAMA
jgi:hypothetical protein